MQDIEIHIGDVLQIRSFEDMKSEFGIDEDGNIRGEHNIWFVNEMKPLCGNVFTVSEFSDEEYRSIEGVEDCSDGTYWSITAWMLEPFEDDAELEVADDNQIALLLS